MELPEFRILLEAQVRLIDQPDLTTFVRSRLVTPQIEHRIWDYGEPWQTFPCWLCLADQPTNTGITYCEQGFGPAYPWGLVFLSRRHSSIGMDSQWYVSLEDAVRESQFWEGKNPPWQATQ